MQTPETRVIHQCTYAPIKPRKEEQVYAIQQPYLKKFLLLTVFPEAKTGKLVLDHLQELHHNKPLLSIDRISTAIEKAWAGDVAGSVRLLRGVDMDNVICAAREGLEAEKLLLEKARCEAEASFATISKRVQAETEAKEQLHQEFETIRETILSEVENIIAPLRAEHLRALPKSKTDGTKARQAAPATKEEREAAIPSALPYNDKTLPKAEVLQPLQPVITSQMIRADITAASPRSTAYMDAVGAFAPIAMTTYIAFSTNALNARKQLLDAKSRVLEGSIEHMRVEPLGYLHLERLQFTPLGYERGELVYSLPMLPGETVRLSHREWSRTETEYSKLVSTEMETATEEAISEKSELTQSTNTQQQHSSAYNASVNASYSGAGFNISSSFGYNCNNSETSSKQYAAKQAQDITKKASSRAKKDSKISFKVTTAYELEEQSYREITNNTGRALRYDFHRLMKKWRIDLYRYDVRMTYDFVIPEPGSYLLRKYVLLKNIEDELAKPNPFNLSPINIVREPKQGGQLSAAEKNLGFSTWVELARQYGISLEPPPEESICLSVPGVVTYSDRQKSGIGHLNIELPSSYEIESWKVSGSAESPLNDEVILPNPDVPEKPEPLYNLQKKFPDLFIYENPVYDPANDNDYKGSQWGLVDPLLQYNRDRLESGMKHSSRFAWMYQYRWSSPKHFHGVHGEDNDIAPVEGTALEFNVDVTAKLTDLAFKQWQMKCHEQLVEAAKLKYENRQESLKKQRDALLEELKREDALMLRKIEKEELMKGVLRWLFGPDFDLYPIDKLNLPSMTLNPDGSLEFYEDGTKNVIEDYWEPALQYGEMIKFLHQAIEWESLNYVLYPYFWTYEEKNRMDFKQSLYHDDYVHRNFLRAGAARVVLTIRPGFEKQFLSFMEGQLDALLDGDHQYMTVADELKAMAMTKYPYTQDANVEKGELLFTWENVPNVDVETEHLLDYIEHDLFTDWGYLFNVDPTFASLLDTGQMPKGLEKALQNHGYHFQNKPGVEVNRARSNWTIKDGKKKVFFIRSTGETLDVYDLTNRPVPVKAGDTMHIARGNNWVEITKDNNEVTAALKESNGRTLDLSLRIEGGQHRIYKPQNWVDTWYEFTPTGALDVKVGSMSDILSMKEEEEPV